MCNLLSLCVTNYHGTVHPWDQVKQTSQAADLPPSIWIHWEEQRLTHLLVRVGAALSILPQTTGGLRSALHVHNVLSCHRVWRTLASQIFTPGLVFENKFQDHTLFQTKPWLLTLQRRKYLTQEQMKCPCWNDILVHLGQCRGTFLKILPHENSDIGNTDTTDTGKK